MLYRVNGHSKQRGNGGQHKGTDQNTQGKPRSLEKTAPKMMEQKTRIVVPKKMPHALVSSVGA